MSQPKPKFKQQSKPLNKTQKKERAENIKKLLPCPALFTEDFDKITETAMEFFIRARPAAAANAVRVLAEVANDSPTDDIAVKANKVRADAAKTLLQFAGGLVEKVEVKDERTYGSMSELSDEELAKIISRGKVK